MKFFDFCAGRRRALCGALVLTALAFTLQTRPVSAQEDFPYNEELLLDAAPMPGSKRVPMLDIRSDGAVLIDLWCNSVQGQLVVAADTITVLTGQKTNRPCSPQRARSDDEILAALEQVTSWRRQGDSLVLIGPHRLIFRRATN